VSPEKGKLSISKSFKKKISTRPKHQNSLKCNSSLKILQFSQNTNMYYCTHKDGILEINKYLLICMKYLPLELKEILYPSYIIKKKFQRYLRNKSWKPDCVGSFNMDWRILVFYPEPEARDKIY
jgi:hypothetical protein